MYHVVCIIEKTNYLQKNVSVNVLLLLSKAKLYVQFRVTFRKSEIPLFDQFFFRLSINFSQATLFLLYFGFLDGGGI